MKNATAILAASILAMSALTPGRSAAQSSAMQATETAALSDGEVRKIDKQTGKVTIRHGPIKHLDMPPMSMVFYARDKALLDKLKVGDKIRFMAVDEGGKMLVTEIQPAN